MNNPVSTKSALMTLAAIYLVADLLCATIFATFTASLLSSGVDLANCGETGVTNEIPGLFAGTLFAFRVALFQGGIFLVVFTAFGVGLSLAVKKVFKIEAKQLWHYGRWALVASGTYALIASTAMNSLLQMGLNLAGSSLGCAVNVHLGFFGSVAAWIITFLAAFAQGTIFLIVGSFFVVFFLVALVLIFGKKDTNAN